jgi:tetratricopeptide (TPR) repeat protein
MKVEHRIRENDDGSKSLLLGDVDRMYGTRVITAITLYPDKAYIEIEGQLYNRTPLPQTFLWWANPAVAVNDNTQSVFPPDVHSVYDHGKRAVSRFPIATGEYYKHDYSAGVDISRYKNIPVPTSYMAEHSDFDFVGGYDYGKKAGLLHVADHHISPGKKQWTWGCGDFGKAWDRNLTDEDGPYIELMTGMYCDNQPDFTWLKPYEEKKFKQYFMPYSEAGYVKNASRRAAINLEVSKDCIEAIVYATEEIKNAGVCITEGDRILLDEKTDISPEKVYKKKLDVKGADRYKVRISVCHDGKEIVSYRETDYGIPRLAEPAKAAKAPRDIQSNEELYLTGQHIEQYRHATYLPDGYYLEGLKRDEGDIRINNAYGMLLLRRGKIEDSEKYFRKAIERLTSLNPNPYDSEAYYNLGLSLFYQEKFDEAYDAFYKATWTSAQQEMAFYYLAVIDSRRGDYEKSLEHSDRGLIKNAHNIKARGLKAAALILLGREDEAQAFLSENLLVDAFDFVSRSLLAEIDSSYREETITGDIENYLQTARDFAEFGLYDRAISALLTCDQESPLKHYYLACYYDKEDKEEDSRKALAAGESASFKYCFPNKLEDIQVLKWTIQADPKGAKAYYYLGCLYYDKLGYDEAVRLWEESEKLDNAFPTLLRNLAIAYYNKRGETGRAKECIERAFSLNRNDARVFLELDQLYARLGVQPAKRLENFEDNIELIEKRDDLYTEYVTVLNLCGRYDKAHEMITSHSFQTWEGAEGKITTQFKLSLYMMAQKRLREGDAKKAIELLEEALSYPENLGEGRLEGTKDNNLYYLLAVVQKKMGEEEKAKENLYRATLGVSEPAGMMYYYDQPADMILYQGLGFKALGDINSANTRFYKLIDYGEHHVNDKFVMDYFAVSMPDMSVFDVDMDVKNKVHCYYLMGLGNLGLGRSDEAMKFFDKALELDNNHQLAALYRREGIE